MSEVKIEIGTAEFHKIRVQTPNCNWVIVLWNAAGRVIIISDFGVWAYFWGHRGSATTEQFLAKLDMDYMGGKMLGINYLLHDEDETVRGIREYIAEQLDDDDQEAERDLVDQLADGEITFAEWCRETSFADAFEFASRTPSLDWVMYWERLWVPHVVPALQTIIADDREPSVVQTDGLKG